MPRSVCLLHLMRVDSEWDFRAIDVLLIPLSSMPLGIVKMLIKMYMMDLITAFPFPLIFYFFFQTLSEISGSSMKHKGIFPHLLMVSSKLVIVGSQLLKAV